jgi:hypothetical protein
VRPPEKPTTPVDAEVEAETEVLDEGILGHWADEDKGSPCCTRCESRSADHRRYMDDLASRIRRIEVRERVRP